MYVPRAKITIPELPRQFVSRPHLLAALDDVQDGSLTLVSAPPGFGKTLLLADWASADPTVDTAWVNLDSDDTDPGRLWAAVLSALVGCPSVPADSELRRLARLQPDGQRDGVAEIVDALDVLPVPIRLVLDNLDELHETGSLRGVEQLIRHHPAGVRLVVASRLDPPLSLPRLRLEGHLAELRATDLRFSLPETERLLKKSGARVSHAQAVELQAGTDGWVAGLRLAAVSISRTGNPDHFLATFPGDDRPLADYLVGEVLSAFPPDTRELLSVLSVCDPLPPALATVLTGHPDAGQRLDWLEHETALISAGPRRDEYRMHRLLGSYLRAELNRRRPSFAAELHATAARWWAEHDRPVEALAEARRAGDDSTLSALLPQVAIPLILAGEHATLRSALTEVDEHAVSGDAWTAAVCALIWERRETTRRDRCGERWALPGRAELAALQTIAELARSDSAPAGLPPTDPALEAISHLAAGFAQLTPGGDRDAARRELGAALRLAGSHGFAYLSMQCEAILAALAAENGDHTEVVAASGRAAAVATAHGWGRSAWSGTAQFLLAKAALLRAEPGSARSLAIHAIEAGGDSIDPDLIFGLSVVLGAATVDTGDQLTGLQQMQQARAEFADRPLAPSQAVAPALMEYRAALALGYHAAAGTVLSWLTDRAGAAPEVELMRAWADVSADDPVDARRRLRPLLSGSARPLLPYTEVEVWVLATQLALAAGDRPAARRALRRALTYAQRLDVLRPFAWAGPAVRELLVHQLGSFGEVEPTAGRALAALRQIAGRPTFRVLSERELETLALLPSLLTLEEIAGDLKISINTVKSHIRAIYAKLDVNTRRGAVVIAHRRGLFPTPH